MDLKQRGLLAAKLMATQRFVAKQHGMRDLGDLSPREYERVIRMTTKHLEIWKQLDRECHPSTQDDNEPFNTLAREYLALKKKIKG